ncbi:DUF6241 domain-containing protein [Neobacillus pocheonensis]|uniref:DUF6241 domain-containing protein n=1 Tax=Neobacillus pocheonensis TaxID=363869 RepID=A0ABT0WAY2_9BACI|nr:DUF6241 domain-containing protein [Neobacillus pocheonensis]
MKKKLAAIIGGVIITGAVLAWYINIPPATPKKDNTTAADTATSTTDDTPVTPPAAPEPPVATLEPAPAPTPTPLNLVQFDLGLTSASTEEDVVNAMHKMSHEKVRAVQKWGALPMSIDTIRQVEGVVTVSKFEHKAQLLAIINKWKSGDFKSADADHNFLWELEGGSEGKAFGLLSPAEEQAYFDSNFQVDVKGVATYSQP